MKVPGIGFESLSLRMDDAEYLEDKILNALDILWHKAGYDGAHHKDWVIDQVARTLLDEDYDDWVAAYEKPDENEEMYREWNTGTP